MEEKRDESGDGTNPERQDQTQYGVNKNQDDEIRDANMLISKSEHEQWKDNKDALVMVPMGVDAVGDGRR